MELSQEEIAANETAASPDFRRNNYNIPTNPVAPEGCRLVASPALCMSASSDWSGSSTLTNLDTVKDYGLNRGKMSLADSTPTLTSPASPYPMNDAGLTVDKVTVRNYGYPSACVVGCSSTKEEINHEGRCSYQFADGDLLSENKNPLELGSREDVRRMPWSFQDAKLQNNVDSSRISTHLTERPTNIISSKRPLGGSPAKTLYSSSFSKFFLGQSQKAMTKGVPNKNPGASAELHTTPMGQNKNSSTLMAESKNMQGYSSEEASDALMSRNSLCNQLREGPELPHCAINLREWLETKGSDASKNDRLRLFRQIVQTVDVAHCQGIALLELRPSSFILLETGDVKYIGSLMEIELLNVNQDNRKKRGLEQEISAHDKFCVKTQKVGEDKLVRPETHFISRFVNDKATNQFNHGIIDMKNSYHSKWKAQNFSIYEGTSTGKCWLTSDSAQLEEKWYAFPEGFKFRDLLSFNIYCLGLLLFECLCHFESMEAHSAAMLGLHHRILPPHFLSESPKEAGFCFWLLHPEPASRPTTREILQSELIYGSESTSLSNGEASCADTVDDAESDLLLHFLVSLKQHKQNKASDLLESMEFLDADIKVVERRRASRKSSNVRGGGYDSRQEPNLKDHRSTEIPYSSISRTNVLREKLLGSISQLENAYFSVRSHAQLTEMPDMDRSDKDVLRKRERWSLVQTQHNLPTMEEKSVDRVETFFDGICKFAHYNKFEVCGTLRNGDILNSNNVICSLSFDREEEYIAAAGVSKKIKIFELGSLLDDYVDVQYPVLEMSNKSKFSCICWNNYIKNYLASTDYDGLVQMWDASTGQGFARYKEHQKRAWSVDFSQVDPTKFASGGDDCSVRIWSINERNSMGTIWNPANICCVQFSAYSSHLLAFGSADYRIYCYDLRHTKIPWCTLAGHGNAVSYVRFLDSETLVSASTDNTLKLWDLKKTSLEGLSPNACSLTFTGHTNEKNFVGLAVLDGYIACGSETNEVYAYYRSLPMPITSHKFGCIDPISGDEISDGNGHFVSSVCWRKKYQMIVAANSSGSIKILRMA
ncbi:hypothetical protein Pfo_005912 [Paulownia fortunei]|nr:hypothetical protein Pfo_005912 [Paulownia fortunei]